MEVGDEAEGLDGRGWYHGTDGRTEEWRQDEEWKEGIREDVEFCKDVASSRGAWRSALGYWIFRDLKQDWFTGDYYLFGR